MQKIGSFTVNRRAAIAVATLIGVGFGLHNAWYAVVDVTLSARMVAYLVLSIPLTAVAHELTHGLTARLLGYRPIYGFKPPLINITFDATVTAVHYKLIAIAPCITWGKTPSRLPLATPHLVYAELLQDGRPRELETARMIYDRFLGGRAGR
jgi:hypothetical protein